MPFSQGPAYVMIGALISVNTYSFNHTPLLSHFVSNVRTRFSDQTPSHCYGMSSLKKHFEGTKPDLAPFAHPISNEMYVNCRRQEEMRTDT